MQLASLPLSALTSLFTDWVNARISIIQESSDTITTTDNMQALETHARQRADYIGIPFPKSLATQFEDYRTED